MNSDKPNGAIAHVLRSLKQNGAHGLSTDDLMGALHEAGVADVRGLVVKLTEARNSSVAGHPPAGAAYGVRQRPDSASIVHQIPRLSLVVDGTPYAPAQISKFNGTALHFTLTDSSTRGRTLVASTTDAFLAEIKHKRLASMMKQINDLDWMPPLPSCPGGTYPPCPVSGGPPSGGPPPPRSPPFTGRQVQMFSD